MKGQSNNSLNFTSLGHFFFKFQDQTGCNKRTQIPPPLSSSCSLFPKLVKPLSSIILNMAHINSPMLHHKYSTVSKIHPPRLPPRWVEEGGSGGVNAPYVTLNLYLQMKHKVPHSHEFATLAPPPLYIANSFIVFEKTKSKNMLIKATTITLTTITLIMMMKCAKKVIIYII